MELPEAVRSRHERERLSAVTDRQADTPLCVYVKVVYNTNFRDECGGLVADAEQAATDVFKRAQVVFTTFQGLDRSINLQLVGCKTNSALHFNLTVQVNSIAFFAKTGDLQRKLKTKN